MRTIGKAPVESRGFSYLDFRCFPVIATRWLATTFQVYFACR